MEGKEHRCFLKKLKKHPLADLEKDDMEVDPSHENDKGNELHSHPDDDEESSDKEKEPKKISVYYFDTETENSGEHTCNCVCVINQEGSEKKVFYGKKRFYKIL